MNRQNYNILAGEGNILRILKEIDKAENRESIGAGIQKLLEVLGNYGNADRTYLFETVHTPEIFTNTYEWCADGITAQRDNLQDVKYMEFLFVALGGAAGAVSRYAISLIPVKSGFPILTLITNIIGAVLIGFIAGIVGSKNEISKNTILFWKTGVCGGFTTFSTFSLEAYNLFENGKHVMGVLYVLLS